MSTTETGSEDRGIAPPKAMIKPFAIMIVAVAVIIGGIFAWQTIKGKFIAQYMASAATAPQTVSTTTAVKMSWQAQTHAIGSLRAVRGADLAAQASGIVDQIHIESGAEVAAGTVLLRLRLNDDPAKLDQLQAAAALAGQNYQRDRVQFAAQAISQSVLDNDVATLKSARAQVAAQQALIGEKIVRAPFAGRLGIRQIDEGQYLTAGSTVVTLQALDPILVDFYVPQQALALLKVGQTAIATVDTYPNAPFSGTITSINSKVDIASRNVQVRASFGNSERRLVPGMYAKIAIDNGAATSEVTLPQAAITYNSYGDTVFVVQPRGTDAKGKPQSVAEQRFVQLGQTRGDQVAITSGVAVGEIVVTGGQMKLHNGSAVTVNNSVTPANDANPAPPNE